MTKELLNEIENDYWNEKADPIDMAEVFDLANKALEQTSWIPVKWHEITDEERVIEEYPNEWLVLFDCQMPDDGERILTQTKWGDIELDECYIDDGGSLDSGRDWIEDIVAWMPLPAPYQPPTMMCEED